TSSPTLRHHAASSAGRINFAYSCVPRGSKPRTYSAPTIASAKLFKLRLMVEKNAVPPGRSAAAHAATIELGSGPGSSTSGHGIALAGRLQRDLLAGDAAVVDRQTAGRGVLPRRIDVLLREVDRDDTRSARREPFCHEAAPAADVENPRPRERNAFRDVVEA